MSVLRICRFHLFLGVEFIESNELHSQLSETTHRVVPNRSDPGKNQNVVYDSDALFPDVQSLIEGDRSIRRTEYHHLTHIANN